MPSTPVKINEGLVKMSSRSGVGYELNRNLAPPLRKVVGEPGVASGAPRAHALREAFVALQIASLAQVEQVLIGDEAYRYIYPNGGPKQKNCDVVGVLEGHRGLVLGEGKATDVPASLRQLSSSAEALARRGTATVRTTFVAARKPMVLTCPVGLVSVSDATGKWNTSVPDVRWAGAVESANRLPLDPRYEYLLLPDGESGPLNGLGMAVSRTGDSLLYSNRAWSGTELLKEWRQIKKLRVPSTDNAPVNITFAADSE
jgi:hypothetical protein